jgi:rhodanese-related sulfurtransferase
VGELVAVVDERSPVPSEMRTAQLLDRLPSVVLVDALGRPYFDSAHLPGAVNIPPHQVPVLAPRLLPNRSAEIVVYGENAESANAAIVLDRLARLGYSNVSVYLDGTQGWIAAGLPVERRTEPD